MKKREISLVERNVKWQRDRGLISLEQAIGLAERAKAPEGLMQALHKEKKEAIRADLAVERITLDEAITIAEEFRFERLAESLKAERRNSPAPAPITREERARRAEVATAAA